MAKRTPGPKLATFNHWPLKIIRGHQIKPRKVSAHSGERRLFTNVLHTMDSGMVHIWYNIPLCTNFSQQSTGDGLRTKLGHLNKVTKSITHFEGSLFSHSVLQSMAASRSPFEDPNLLALQELGFTFFQDYSKANSKILSSIQSVVKASSTSVFLGQLNWPIKVVLKQAVWP
ncbi:hypothetical protein O181_117115 [Austropuccinia psidii MF-1]|uniref:Uncharacterized protein n=1 Tax=Austropuccinia psidii MF-1 TaxID=1389203 RepID=A0A9Q3PY37_9BASI|nr:hypothetical protein [Austropuccinia psidii MF-1]